MIYFLKDTVTQEIKIGYSKKNPKQRLRDCQTGNPHKLILLGSIMGKMEDEGGFHSRFAEHRLEGEWFDGKIVEEVLKIISVHQEQRRTIKRRIMSDSTAEPKVNGEAITPEINHLSSNGTLDKDSGIEGISRITGLKLKKLSVTLTENEGERHHIYCGAEVVYLLEFEADVADEAALNELRTNLLMCDQRQPTAKRLRHTFVDEDNAMIPFIPEMQDHHIVGGKDALTGVAGDAIRVLVRWRKPLLKPHNQAKVKGVFVGDNYVGEHPLKKAKKMVISIR